MKPIVHALGVDQLHGRSCLLMSQAKQNSAISANGSKAIDPDYQRKLEKLRLLELKAKLESELPHLYGFPLYRWQRRFLDSTANINLISAANQIGKSSIAIKKCIHWATEPKIWPEIFGKHPQYFMYLMPSLKLFTREFENKWVPEFLPRGSMKDHPQFGWSVEYKNKEVHVLRFNTGVNVYFLSYAMDPADLQASSPTAVFCDEELDPSLFPELWMRLGSHRKGNVMKAYFHMVATPTIGYQFWKDAYEGDKFPDALKLSVSMYDCLEYENGLPGAVSKERIKETVAVLGSEREIQMRVYGRYMAAEGLIYSAFDRKTHIKEATIIPPNWVYFAGIDNGSGGGAHLPAIAIVACSPDYRQGRLIKLWQGEETQNYTAGDVIEKYESMAKNYPGIVGYYDYAAKDLGTIAIRKGLSVQKAEKARDFGQGLFNTLLKAEILTIDASDEAIVLARQLESLRHGYDTKHTTKESRDDLADASRYAIAKIPWVIDAADAASIMAKAKKKANREPEITRDLNPRSFYEKSQILDEMDKDIDEFAELLEA